MAGRSGNFPTFDTTGNRGQDEYLRRLESRIAALENPRKAPTNVRPPDSFTVSQNPLANSLAIGQNVGGGTATRVLYEDSNVQLADSASFTFDDATGAMVVTAVDQSTTKAFRSTELTSSTNSSYSGFTAERISTGAIAAGFGVGFGANAGQNSGASVQWGACMWEYDGSSTHPAWVLYVGTTKYVFVRYSGQMELQIAGAGFSIKEGSNCKMGQATLVSGYKLVSNTSVTANSRIFLQSITVGGDGIISLGSIVAATSFEIVSSDVSDTRTVNYIIFEPS